MNRRTLVLPRARYHKKVSLAQNAVKAAVLLAVTYTCVLGGGQVQAQTPVQLATFNFNTATSTTALLTPTAGVYKSTSTLSTNFTTPTDVTNFAGTTVNAQNSDPAGQALALVNQTENGNALLLTTSSTGYNNLVLSFATQKTGTGFNSNTLAYSINGGAFADYMSTPSSSTNPYNPATAFALQSFDLSSVPGLNNQSNISFRITFTGATSASGNNRIDNFNLSGNAITPAPPGVVSAGIGFGVTGMGALLSRRKQAKAAKTAEAAV